MKKQGKIRSISVKEVAEGMQILTPNGIGKILGKIHGFEGVSFVSVGLKEEKRIEDYQLDQLKTIVVVYEEALPGLLGGLGKPKIEHHTKQLPLKYSQWQAAINNGEVDSDKIVEFEEMIGPQSKSRTDSYSKIIPQKKKLYTQEDVHNLMMQAWINGEAKPGQHFSVRENWIEETLKNT